VPARYTGNSPVDRLRVSDVSGAQTKSVEAREGQYVVSMVAKFAHSRILPFVAGLESGHQPNSPKQQRPLQRTSD
jgi:hypothetical protein